MRLFLAVLGVLSVAACASASDKPLASGQSSAFKPRPFVTGLADPVFVGATASEKRRLYVVEQAGRIVVVDSGRRRAKPFLDIRSLVTSGGEQGLLGLAFHPRYAQNRRFYVQYTDRGSDTRLVEYRSNGTSAIPGSARVLFSSDDPYSNHNGGMLAFAPNGRLLFTMGDGGSGGDPENRAQNPRSLFGKLLSINVATKGLKIEAYGLRNAWRFSFDRANGDLYIGDVGQGELEEISYTQAPSAGLENYGWDVYEGRAKFEDKSLGPGRLVQPIAQYSRADGCSVTGGYVYRGSNAALRGRYIYGDFCSGNIWSLKIVRGKATGLRREPFKVESVSSFGEDASGELYAVSHDGTIFRLTP
ncbi:MAG: PQQ-dependent sugar dehydrogenase [Actinobacteria bacterium]|nr:PQQ-dependent sugar dehydrogenase [Actinomycetota bacterium]